MASRQGFIHPDVSKHLPNGSLIIVFAVDLVFVQTVCTLVGSTGSFFADNFCGRPTSSVQLDPFIFGVCPLMVSSESSQLVQDLI